MPVGAWLVDCAMQFNFHQKWWWTVCSLPMAMLPLWLLVAAWQRCKGRGGRTGVQVQRPSAQVYYVLGQEEGEGPQQAIAEPQTSPPSHKDTLLCIIAFLYLSNHSSLSS